MNSIIKLKGKIYLMTMKILTLLALEIIILRKYVTLESIGLYLDGLGGCIRNETFSIACSHHTAEKLLSFLKRET